jgi:protein-tyrosine phosphatase
MRKIVDGIWLGGLDDCPQDLPTIHLGEDCNHIPQDERNQHYLLQDTDEDAPRIIDILNRSSDFITKWRQIGRGIFIHCTAGVSRSATLIFLYLWQIKEVTSINDYRMLCPQWNPNFGFQQLFTKLGIP